jgi:ribose-phosphate pyrophosphokinase
MARDITNHLHMPLGRAHVELMENARGRDVFIMQPTCPPTNDT